MELENGMDIDLSLNPPHFETFDQEEDEENENENSSKQISLYQSDPTSQVIYAHDDFFVKNDPGMFKSDPNVILQTDSDFGSSCGQSRETGDTENTGLFISEPGTSALALCDATPATSFDMNEIEHTEMMALEGAPQGEPPEGYDHIVLDQVPEEIFDEIPEKMETEREKADPNWHMFRVSQLLENSEQTDDYYTKLESLLKLNLAIQQRTKNAIKRLQGEHARIRERSMIVEARMRHECSNIGRTYTKPILLNHFRHGYFLTKDGWPVPKNVNDENLEKFKALYPFDPDKSEVSKRWSKKEDMDLRAAVNCSVSRPMVSKIKRKVESDEAEVSEKIKEMNKQIRAIKNKSNRDLLGGRKKKHDWEAISITSMDDKRTEIECQLRWRNVLHPDLSGKPFSKQEKLELDKWVKKYGSKGSWQKVAEKIQNRSALQCFTEWRKLELLKDKGRAWTKEEDRTLLKAVSHVQNNDAMGISWNAVAHYLEGRTPAQCTHRFKKSVDPNIKRGTWKIEEDIALLKAVHELGEEWAKIRDTEVIPGRTDMQIRDRYYNALSPGHIRGPWTEEEDMLLREGFNLYGTHWTLVAGHIKTRNDGQCLKRWTLLDEYKKAKRPMKYGKSSKPCKLKRCNDLRKIINKQIEENKRDKELVHDPDLVILEGDRGYADGLNVIEENREFINSALYGNPNILEQTVPDPQALSSGEPLALCFLDGKDVQKSTFDKFTELVATMYQPEKSAKLNKGLMKDSQDILSNKWKNHGFAVRKDLRRFFKEELNDENYQAKLDEYKLGENKFLPVNSASVRVARALTSGVKFRLLKKTAQRAKWNKTILKNDRRMLSLKKTLQSLCLTSAMAKKNIPFNKECPDETVGFNRKKFEEMVEEKSKNPCVEDLNISTASETPSLVLSGSVESTSEQESACVASGNAMAIAIPAQDEERN